MNVDEQLNRRWMEKILLYSRIDVNRITTERIEQHNEDRGLFIRFTANYDSVN